MGVRGKSMYDWEYATFCDFGNEKIARAPVAKHFSLPAAKRAFVRLKKIYSHESRTRGRENWRVWQTSRNGQIINDTGKFDPVIYA